MNRVESSSASQDQVLRRYGVWIPFVAAILTSCESGGSAANGATAGPDGNPWEVLVGSNVDVVGEIADLDFGPDGRLYGADYQYGRIIVVDTASGALHTIGREGGVPGEFRLPTAVRASDDGILAFDSQNQRLVLMGTDGSVIRTTPVQVTTYAVKASLDRDGNLATATGGFGEGLAVVVDGTGRARSYGTALPLPQRFTPEDVRNDLRRGIIPNLFRNNVVAARAPDGSVFLAHMAEAVVHRYHEDGRLEWSVTVADAVHEALFDRYVALNLSEQDPMRVHPFRMFADIVVDDGRLWLLGPPEAQNTVVWQMDPTNGSILERYEVAGLTGAAAVTFSPDGEWAFFADNSLARILKARLRVNSGDRVTTTWTEGK